MTHAILRYKEVGGGEGEGGEENPRRERGRAGSRRSHPRQKNQQPEWRKKPGPRPRWLTTACPASVLLTQLPAWCQDLRHWELLTKKKKKKTQILSSPGGIKCDAIESEWPVTEGRQEKLMSPGGARIRGSSHPEMIH